jgi:catechol 2,3-dioxygenase
VLYGAAQRLALQRPSVAESIALHSKKYRRNSMSTNLKAAFKHVGLYVMDLDKMADFYQRWFGLIKTDGGMGGSGKGVFLSADPTEHHQIVFVVGRDPASKPTINQLSFLVDSLATLKAYHHKALEEKTQITMIKSHGNALSLYVLDPEGNQCEIYCNTPWHVGQPAGKPMDLSLPEEAILAQVEREVRADPTFKMRDEWMAEVASKMAA